MKKTLIFYKQNFREWNSMIDNFLRKIDPYLDGKIVTAGAGKWLYYPEHHPLVMQIETLHNQQLLCHVSLSKRGEGLFLTSFLTMLMIEEIHAFSEDILPDTGGRPGCRCEACAASMPRFGCVSGTVSLTYFSRLNWTQPSYQNFVSFCDEFMRFVAEKAQDYLPETAHENGTAFIANLSDTRLSYLLSEVEE